MSNKPIEASLLDRCWEALSAASTPQLGQLINWVLIAVCLIVGCLSFTMVPGERQSPATLFSWLPTEILASALSFHVCRTLLIVGALLWLFQIALPWSCWLATGGLLGLWSIHMENTTNSAHIFHAASQLLIVQSLWITFCAVEIRQALRKKRYWQTPLYPNWAFWLGLAVLGLFHSYAGLAKLSYSGFDWANGTSLQLWVYWDGRPGSWTRELIMNYRPVAIALQWATLVFETAGIFVLFDRRLRLVIGLMIMSFYLGVLLTFDYGFHINLLLTALYHLPFDRWLTRANEHRPVAN